MFTSGNPPGQCSNKNTVSPSRYCMRFIIFSKLSNSLTTGYMCLCVLYVGHNLAGQSHGSRNRLLCNTRNFSASLYKNTANLHLQLSLPIATLITAKKNGFNTIVVALVDGKWKRQWLLGRFTLGLETNCIRQLKSKLA